jgi:anti-sigma factor RsiW
MDERLTQNDFEELSAYMDGELTPAATSRIRNRLQTSPAWRRALERLQAVDTAIGAYVVPPAPGDLAQRVLRRTAQAHRPLHFARPSLRWLAPLTAAATIVAALLVYGAINRPMRHKNSLAGGTSNAAAPATAPAPQASDLSRYLEEDEDYPEVAEMDTDPFVQDQLDFFRDLGVVNNLDTIEAIYNQQAPGGGT